MGSKTVWKSWEVSYGQGVSSEPSTRWRNQHTGSSATLLLEMYASRSIFREENLSNLSNLSNLQRCIQDPDAQFAKVAVLLLSMARKEKRPPPPPLPSRQEDPQVGGSHGLHGRHGRHGRQWRLQLDERILGVLLTRCLQAWRSLALEARRSLQKKLNVVSYRFAMQRAALALLRCALHSWINTRERPPVHIQRGQSCSAASVSAIWCAETLLTAPPGLPRLLASYVNPDERRQNEGTMNQLLGLEGRVTPA